MSEEEKKAIENVKNMFEGITIDSLNKKSKMTIYCLGIADILLFINAFDNQQKEIEELKNGNIDFWISDKEIETRIKSKYISKYKIMEIAKEYIEDETIDLHGFYMKVMRLLRGNKI